MTDMLKELAERNAEVAQLRRLLRAVLDRDADLASSKSDCSCIFLSRDAEREYETGTCPHQLARAALAGKIESYDAEITRLREALKPFAEVATAIKATDFFQSNDVRRPSLDTPISMLVQRLGDPVTIGAVFAAHAALDGRAGAF